MLKIFYINLGVAIGFTVGFAMGFKGCLIDRPNSNLTSNIQNPNSYYLTKTFVFIKAIDGDTVDLSRDTSGSSGSIFRVRLHGIDTPERGKFYYAQAAAQLTALCEGQKIRLADIGDGKFDRISANIYCGEVFVNAALVESGAAITAIKYADDDLLYALQSEARLACRGVWAQPIDTTYSANRLTGYSPIHGKITLTNNQKCLRLSQLSR